MDRRSGLLLGLLALPTFSGCSTDPDPRPLGADAFYRRNDRGGALPPGPRVGETPVEEAVGKPANAPAAGAVDQPSPDALAFVTKQVKSTTPGTQPSDAPRQAARPV